MRTIIDNDKYDIIMVTILAYWMVTVSRADSLTTHKKRYRDIFLERKYLNIILKYRNTISFIYYFITTSRGRNASSTNI